MKLVSLNIPEDVREVPAWLEQHLVGFDLAALAAELAAVHKPPADQRITLQEVLGNRQEAVLKQGLRVLPGSILRLLLLRPGLLLELQELVFSRGEEYWKNLSPAIGEHQALLDGGRVKLRNYLTAQKPARAPEPEILTLQPRQRWYRKPWVAGLASAAAVLLLVATAIPFIRPYLGDGAGALAWGWNKPDALQAKANGGEYLNQLANEANEWFNKRPQNAAELAQRIGEFRLGCSRLILSQHPALSEKDRTWLRERCLAWAQKLDNHLTAVEKGRDAAEVLNEADQTINSLVTALRDRATQA